MLLIRGFNFKVDTDITARAYGKLPRAFPELDRLPTEQRTRTRVAFLSGIKSVSIDCCIDVCVAFTGEYEPFDTCPQCGKDRYEPDPQNPDRVRPRKTFKYIPIATRLVNMYRDPEMAEKLSYRHKFHSSDGIFRDVFNGALYERLRSRRVWVRGERLEHKYFDMPTDIALGLSTDGFGPFKSRKQTCWPLILFNYNLPPSIRFHLEHVMCLGVIPGPTQPKELGTFLKPLIDELETLAEGVSAYDGINKRPFCLRAYLIACFGDMPAVAKLMCMKGHGSKVPCRACRIVGVLGTKTKYYAPLSRPFANNPEPYNPLKLPLRTHQEYIRQATDVEFSHVDAEEDRRATRFGINLSLIHI